MIERTMIGAKLKWINVMHLSKKKKVTELHYCAGQNIYIRVNMGSVICFILFPCTPPRNKS